MIAALMCGASLGAAWVAVCTALWVRQRMPWPRWCAKAPTVRAFRPCLRSAGDPCGGPDKEAFLGMLPVTRFELAPSGGLDVCPFETEGLIRNFELSATNNRRNRENTITKV